MTAYRPPLSRPVKERLARARPIARLLGPVALTITVLVLALGCLPAQPPPASATLEILSPELGLSGSALSQSQVVTSFSILVDDFKPQPYQGNAVYYYNRLGGDRGSLEEGELDWGQGQVTTTVTAGHTWGGLWLSLNHPSRESEAVNFSAILPSQILPAYQSEVTGLTIQVLDATPGADFRIELKDTNTPRWSQQTVLSGGPQRLEFQLGPLSDVSMLLWVLDPAAGGDYVVVDHVALTATTSITDIGLAGFVWSYGMLLNNWNPDTGLVRDVAKYASGEFDGIQSTGSLAAATALAAQLGIVNHADAVQIVTRISHTLLIEVPRYHGLWPHFVEVSPSGDIIIEPNTEWSSVDTTIAAIALLDAQSALGLDTSGTEELLRGVDWSDLRTPGGISHGYTYSGARLSSAWDTFGGESWLVALAYAAATGEVPPLAYATPPTANGSGFIDELAWLFVLPPQVEDHWGVDWNSYRQQAASAQVSYYAGNYLTSCFDQLGLFGLSAGEVPLPSAVASPHIYQAFGIGGRYSPANDGSSLLGQPVVVPHYAAIIASLRPAESISTWAWLINHGPLSPLNNVESLMFVADSGCETRNTEWNHLKGSWNLALQTLGWGRYVAGARGENPNLWRATLENDFIRNGYVLLVPDGVSSVHLPLILKH